MGRHDPRIPAAAKDRPAPADASPSTTCSAPPSPSGRDALALIDPPDREAFTSGAPRRLTYVASRSRRHRHRGAAAPGRARARHVVALQMPNTVEAVLALLGVLRAGLIASPLPLLWRRADCTAAIIAVGARALITMGRVGATDHGGLAAAVAAQAPTRRPRLCIRRRRRWRHLARRRAGAGRRTRPWRSRSRPPRH